MPKYIFITGGVVSSLGKGVACASIGKLLESRGLKVNLIKCDPYINVDPGTMNPYQHGEVYVTEDGAETDLDLGHYERFTSVQATKDNNITTGKVYYSVIRKERRGEFLGGTVQVIPHITDEIKSLIKNASAGKHFHVVIVEIGGTVGDIEGLPFLEAIRQLRLEMGRNKAINVHMSLVPFIKAASELKTKPTQHSVGKLREIGIQPDIILCRTEYPIAKEIRKKIALFCNVEEEAVIQAQDVPEIYQIPLVFNKEGLDDLIIKKLNLKGKENGFDDWRTNVVEKLLNPVQKVEIAVVGKYIQLQDAYKSIYESLKHGGIPGGIRVMIKRVDSEEVEKKNPEELFDDVDGILIPGGFGIRGIEGKISTVQYAREKKVPFFGICLGMQLAVIEFARTVLGYNEANSTEFNDKTKYPVIHLLKEQRTATEMGGTMRLGAYPCSIRKNSKTRGIYGKKLVYERHRHRYEFNNKFREKFTEKGMIFSGIYREKNLVEIVELREHPWFVGVQFHPEFKSKPDRPHPLFRSFIEAALCRKSQPK